MTLNRVRSEIPPQQAGGYLCLEGKLAVIIRGASSIGLPVVLALAKLETDIVTADKDEF